MRTGVRTFAIRPVGIRGDSQKPEEKKAGEKSPDSLVIPLPSQGQIKITIDVQGQGATGQTPGPPDELDNAVPGDLEGDWTIVEPQDSDRVFVCLTAFNSKNYYILGDLLVPGRMPHTGHETVFDAIESGGGLLPTADPKDIRLVRPGREGKPSKVYKVDLEAIQEKGDVRPNYQLFPGDRLIVGRNEVVKRTIEIDRLYAPIHAIVTSIRQNTDLLKSIGALAPDRSDEVLKNLVDFWAKEVSRKGERKFDEQTLREILLRQLKTAPAAPRLGPGPGAR